MNITYLLGNGFDVNLGLKTRYKDFYTFYCNLPLKEESEAVMEFRKAIEKEHENWSDLEESLGRYTNKIKTIEDFKLIHNDVTKHLNYYLLEEQKKLQISMSQKVFFHNALTCPTTGLPSSDLEAFENIQRENENILINIISFN